MILVDSHVHIYDCFALDSLFNAAYDNFHKAAQLYAPEDTSNVFFLLLAESTSHNWFDSLASIAQGKTPVTDILADWTIHTTSEKTSLRIQAKNNTGHSLILIAGRQYITKEKLEVLGLLSTDTIAEGLPLAETIKAIHQTNAIPVIPWGVGKWLGQRGKLLEGYLQSLAPHPKKLYMGDNSGRPLFWPLPAHFQTASQKKISNLSGSDPLPLKNEYTKPGSYGIFFQGRITQDTPGHDLKQQLFKGDKLNHYGKQERFFRFFANQLAIRFK